MWAWGDRHPDGRSAWSSGSEEFQVFLKDLVSGLGDVYQGR